MGNRLLPWISERFKTKGTYLIIRRPCAVISSQLKAGWIGYPHNIKDEIRRGNPAIIKIIKKLF